MLNWLQLSFIGYFVVLMVIGLLGRKQTNDVDFIVGGRRSNFWLTALNAHASDMSAWVFMAIPAGFFLQGMPNMWLIIGLVVGMFLNWRFIAKKLRVQTEQLGCCTLSTFFERRFQDRSHIIRTLTALISVFFLTAYVSSGLIAMGNLFEYVFDVDYYIGLVVAAGVVATYICVGGFQAVARTDFFQGMFLLAVILIVPVVAYSKIAGWGAIETVAQHKQISLALLPDISWSSMLAAFALAASWGLGYFGQPHIITKFMGIKNPDEIVKSQYFGITWQILVLGAGAMVGLVGIVFFNQEDVVNPEMIFMQMSQELFVPHFAGVILCGVLAASMSTIASQILVCASALSEDLYKEMRKEAVTSSHLLKVSRLSVALVSAIALCIALVKSATVMEVVFYAWTGLGCSFGPLVIMSLYSRHANRYGAIAGVCVGGGLAATWSLINPYLTSYPIPAMLPAFFLSLATIYVVSYATRQSYAPLPQNGVGSMDASGQTWT